MAQLSRDVSLGIFWELTEKEALTGQLLTDLNKKVLQNLKNQHFQRRFNLSPDPQNYEAFIQQEAELRGAIVLIETLLDNSAQAEKQLLSLSQNVD